MSKPRARAKITKEPQSSLIEALKFVSVAQKDIGTPYQTHITLASLWAIGFDGVLAAGAPITENLDAAPNTTLFLDALTKCGSNYSIVQLDEDKLSVKTDKFRAFIPCLTHDLIQDVAPDTPVAAINNNLKTALAIVAPLASDNAQQVVTASILVRKGSVVATNRHLMFEAWHAIDLPTICIPKIAATAIIKCDKPLARFGFSENTATFYFEDGSWIRTQLYAEQWPNVDRILEVKANPWPIPPDFYKGVKAVASFNDEGQVFFGQNIIRSHRETNIGASYDVSGIPAGLCFSSKYLLMLEPFVKAIDFVGYEEKAYFYGDNFRGALCSIRHHAERTEPLAPAPASAPIVSTVPRPWSPASVAAPSKAVPINYTPEYQAIMDAWRAAGSDPDTIPF